MMDMDLSFQQAKILIVDDDPPIVSLLMDLLETSGYTHVRSTTDERTAVTIYQEWQPDLVLLDLHMRYRSGFDIIGELAEIEQDYLPILVLTADQTQEVRQRALDTGAKDFLHKPFDPLEALARIHNIIEVRLLHKSLRQHNAALEDRVRVRTQELHEMHLEIVRRLGQAVEYRDNETGLHAIRMSQYATLLAQFAGMSSLECETLLHACPMHDIGKIGIPDRILLKPARLDPEEWTVMKTHTTIGATLLSGHDSELMQMAHLTALTHHEKWDGTGYPYGLQGDEIPLVGRITAICDVFDALTSTRPYKPAWSVEASITEIKEQRGTHFDPALLDQFCEILPEILLIQQQYADPQAAA